MSLIYKIINKYINFLKYEKKEEQSQPVNLTPAIIPSPKDVGEVAGVKKPRGLFLTSTYEEIDDWFITSPETSRRVTPEVQPQNQHPVIDEINVEQTNRAIDENFINELSDIFITDRSVYNIKILKTQNDNLDTESAEDSSDRIYNSRAGQPVEDEDSREAKIGEDIETLIRQSLQEELDRMMKEESNKLQDVGVIMAEEEYIPITTRKHWAREVDKSSTSISERIPPDTTTPFFKETDDPYLRMYQLNFLKKFTKQTSNLDSLSEIKAEEIVKKNPILAPRENIDPRVIPHLKKIPVSFPKTDEEVDFEDEIFFDWEDQPSEFQKLMRSNREQCGLLKTKDSEDILESFEIIDPTISNTLDDKLTRYREYLFDTYRWDVNIPLSKLDDLTTDYFFQYFESYTAFKSGIFSLKENIKSWYNYIFNLENQQVWDRNLRVWASNFFSRKHIIQVIDTFFDIHKFLWKHKNKLYPPYYYPTYQRIIRVFGFLSKEEYNFLIETRNNEIEFRRRQANRVGYLCLPEYSGQGPGPIPCKFSGEWLLRGELFTHELTNEYDKWVLDYNSPFNLSRPYREGLNAIEELEEQDFFRDLCAGRIRETTKPLTRHEYNLLFWPDKVTNFELPNSFIDEMVPITNIKKYNSIFDVESIITSTKEENFVVDLVHYAKELLFLTPKDSYNIILEQVLIAYDLKNFSQMVVFKILQNELTVQEFLDYTVFNSEVFKKVKKILLLNQINPYGILTSKDLLTILISLDDDKLPFIIEAIEMVRYPEFGENETLNSDKISGEPIDYQGTFLQKHPLIWAPPKGMFAKNKFININDFLNRVKNSLSDKTHDKLIHFIANYRLDAKAIDFLLYNYIKVKNQIWNSFSEKHNYICELSDLFEIVQSALSRIKSETRDNPITYQGGSVPSNHESIAYSVISEYVKQYDAFFNDFTKDKKMFDFIIKFHNDRCNDILKRARETRTKERPHQVHDLVYAFGKEFELFYNLSRYAFYGDSILHELHKADQKLSPSFFLGKTCSPSEEELNTLSVIPRNYEVLRREFFEKNYGFYPYKDITGELLLKFFYHNTYILTQSAECNFNITEAPMMELIEKMLIEDTFCYPLFKDQEFYDSLEHKEIPSFKEAAAKYYCMEMLRDKFKRYMFHLIPFYPYATIEEKFRADAFLHNLDVSFDKFADRVTMYKYLYPSKTRDNIRGKIAQDLHRKIIDLLALDRLPTRRRSWINIVNSKRDSGSGVRLDTCIPDEFIIKLFKDLKFRYLDIHDMRTIPVHLNDGRIMPYLDRIFLIKQFDLKKYGQYFSNFELKQFTGSEQTKYPNTLPTNRKPRVMSIYQLRLLTEIRNSPYFTESKNHAAIKNFLMKHTYNNDTLTHAQARGIYELVVNDAIPNDPAFDAILRKIYDLCYNVRWMEGINTFVTEEIDKMMKINKLDRLKSAIEITCSGRKMTSLEHQKNLFHGPFIRYCKLLFKTYTGPVDAAFTFYIKMQANEKYILLNKFHDIIKSMVEDIPKYNEKVAEDCYELLLDNKKLLSNTRNRSIFLGFRINDLISELESDEFAQENIINKYHKLNQYLLKQLKSNEKFQYTQIEHPFSHLDNIDLDKINPNKEEVEINSNIPKVLEISPNPYENIFIQSDKTNVVLQNQLFYYVNTYINELNDYIQLLRPRLNVVIHGITTFSRGITTFLNDIKRGFFSTQAGITRPIYDVNEQWNNPRTGEAEGSVTLSTTQNQLQHKLNLKQRDFPSIVKNKITLEPINSIIPYKSIESHKILSFGGERRVEGFQYQSRRLHDFTYFNIKALSFKNLMPRERMTPFFNNFKELFLSPDALILKKIIQAINAVKDGLSFGTFGDNKIKSLIDFYDLAAYTKEGVHIFDKILFSAFPNLNKSNISYLDTILYNILKYQNLEPQCKPIIIKFLNQTITYNALHQVIKKSITFSIDDFYISHLNQVEDKYPYLGSPLKHLAANVKISINNGLVYTFRLIGLKDNLTQLTIFTNDSYISFFHFIQTNYNKESSWVRPKEILQETLNLVYLKSKSLIQKGGISFLGKKEIPKIRFGGRFLLGKKEIPKIKKYSEIKKIGVIKTETIVKNEGNNRVFLIQEHVHNYPHYHDLYIIAGDNKVVQRFTQLSSYKELMNPALRSLLQFDFGYIKLDYNNMLKGNFLTRKFILNINYKINIDKSFSSSPKLELFLNNKTLNQTKNYIFSEFFKQSNFFLTPYGIHVKRTIRRYLSNTYKRKELMSNLNILKQTYLSNENNAIYDNTYTHPIDTYWGTIINTDKLMKLSASWVKMYRAREFAKNLNGNIYHQLWSYNIVGTIYAAPFKNLTPLTPTRFRSQYRYMLTSKNLWPSINGGFFYPSFVFEPFENRVAKIYEILNTTTNYSKKQLDYFFFSRDYNFLNLSHGILSELCVTEESKKIPTSLLPKTIHYKKVKDNLSREMGLFYYHIEKCITDIIKNPTKALGCSFYRFGDRIGVPIAKLSTKLKNQIESIALKSSSYVYDVKYFNGFDLAYVVTTFIDAFDIQVSDKDPRKWALILYTFIPPYRLFYKKPGIPIMHQNIRGPYHIFLDDINNRINFKFDIIIVPNQTAKAYINKRYTNIFAHYLWSQANELDLKPMMMATPNEQFEFSKGNVLDLYKSTIFKHSFLLNTSQQGNYYLSFFKVKQIKNQFITYFLNSIDYITGSVSNLNIPQPKLIHLSQLILFDSNYWNSGVIAWHIQTHKLYCQLFTADINSRAFVDLKALATNAITFDPDEIKRAGSSGKYDADIYDDCFFSEFLGKNGSYRRLTSFAYGQFDKFKIRSSFRKKLRINKLRLIKKSDYTFSMKHKTVSLRKAFRKIKEYKIKKPLLYTTAKKLKREVALDDPYICNLINKTIYQSTFYEGLDWKMFNNLGEILPPILRNNKHINALIGDFIKKLDQTQPLALPEQKNNKLIEVKKKDLILIKKNKLSEFYETINDLLKNDTYSWITFHEYRDELIRHQTISIPGGIISSLCTTFCLGSIFTFILLAADYRRAPNKKSASRLVSWKIFMLLLLCSFAIYIFIDSSAYDIFTELLQQSRFSLGIQKVPHNVILPHQVNHTIDDYDSTAFKTPFFTKKEATWHTKRLEAIIDYIFPDKHDNIVEINPKKRYRLRKKYIPDFSKFFDFS